MAQAGLFDGLHATTASVSRTCPVGFACNKYSVKSNVAGCPVDIHAYADCIVIKLDGFVVGKHGRTFGRNQTAYDRWQSFPALARESGAPRNGALLLFWPLVGCSCC
jgi:hypothetical protein